MLLASCRLPPGQIVTHCFPHSGRLIFPTGGHEQPCHGFPLKVFRMVYSKIKGVLLCTRMLHINFAVSQEKPSRELRVDSSTDFSSFATECEVGFERLRILTFVENFDRLGEPQTLDWDSRELSTCLRKSFALPSRKWRSTRTFHSLSVQLDLERQGASKPSLWSVRLSPVDQDIIRTGFL